MYDVCRQAETEKSENLFLYIDLPRFDFPVIFSEPVGAIQYHMRGPGPIYLQETSNHPITTITHTSTVSSQLTTANLLYNINNDVTLWSVIDPDVVHDNPVEDKHRRLVRSHRGSPYDRELKPNAKIRDELGVGNCQFFFSQRLSDTFLGHPELFPKPAAHLRRERSRLEISVLFSPR